MKFKDGQKVRKVRNGCCDNLKIGELGIYVEESKGVFKEDDKKGDIFYSCTRLDLFEPVEKTIEDVVVGDELTNNGENYMVAAKVGDIVFLTYEHETKEYRGASGPFTIPELKAEGHTLKQPVSLCGECKQEIKP